MSIITVLPLRLVIVPGTLRGLEGQDGNLIQSSYYGGLNHLIVIQTVFLEGSLNPKGVWHFCQAVLCQTDGCAKPCVWEHCYDRTSR